VIRGLKAEELTGFAIVTMKLKNGIETFDAFYHELTDSQALTGTLSIISKVRDDLEEHPETPIEATL
jgi:hypothetical protein